MAASPTIEATALHRVSRDEALAFVDEKLGDASEWPSLLMQYRLKANFQSDWKEELGHWLKTAERFGFLDRVMHEIAHQAKRRSKKDNGQIDANDPRHLKLHHHLAATRVTYYLTGTGWGFVGYEPESGGDVDIDVSLAAPDGRMVECQVKAPDQPGKVVNQKIVDGEDDSRITHDIDKASRQLRRPPTGPAMIAICANRDWPFAWNPTAAVVHLIGSTYGNEDGSRTWLEAANRGAFFADEWKHVSGVMFLDIARGEDRVTYPCTVLLNPLATFPVLPSWLPYARVSYLEENVFRWAGGAPPNGNTLPEGAVLTVDHE